MKNASPLDSHVKRFGTAVCSCRAESVVGWEMHHSLTPMWSGTLGCACSTLLVIQDWLLVGPTLQSSRASVPMQTGRQAAGLLRFGSLMPMGTWAFTYCACRVLKYPIGMAREVGLMDLQIALH